MSISTDQWRASIGLFYDQVYTDQWRASIGLFYDQVYGYSRIKSSIGSCDLKVVIVIRCRGQSWT